MPIWLRAREFGKDCRGAVAILFAVALPAILGSVGIAIDYSSAMQQKSSLQSAADSAALNAARELIISEPTPARVSAIASQTVTAILQTSSRQERDWTVRTSVAEDRKALKVEVKRTITPVFGLLNKLYGFASAEFGETAVQATARLSHNSKLCLLTMGDNDTSILLQANARLTGASCSIHSNSRGARGIALDANSKLVADLVCSRGGIQNRGSTVQSEILHDCPPVIDPLRARIPPPVGNCLQSAHQVIREGNITLKPGTYCGGIDIRGTAEVTLGAGTYVFLNGPLTVRENASLKGVNVGLFFKGETSYFRFVDNALVDLTGPKDGAMSGILVWRDRLASMVDKSAAKPAEYTNVINANRARRLTGTIYLPEGTLYIGAPAPVAQISDYTVILARKLVLADGPNLVLNTNYAGSDVPVPQDLGPIGLRNLKLER